MPSPRPHPLRTAPLRLALLLLGVALLAAGCDEGTAKSKAITPKPITATGALDTTFGTGGMVQIDNQVGTPGATGNAILIDSLGRILIGGSTGNPVSQATIWRLLPSGFPDAGFGAGGVWTFNNATAAADGVGGISLDGQFIYAAGKRHNGTVYDMALWRLFGSGTQSWFTTSSGASGSATGNDNAAAVVTDASGNAVAAGTTDALLPGDMAVWRFDNTGGVDGTFNGSGSLYFDGGASLDDDLFVVALDANGKIVVAGQATAGGGFQMFAGRLNPNGTWDTSFNSTGTLLDPGSGAATAAQAVVILPSGKILLGGYTTVGGVDEDIMIWRLASGGVLDTTFGGGTGRVSFDGIGGVAATNEVITGMAVDSQGRIVVTGTAYNPSGPDSVMMVARLTPAGALDTTFGTGGVYLEPVSAFSLGADAGNAVAIAPDGHVFVTGTVEGASGTLMTVWKFK